MLLQGIISDKKFPLEKQHPMYNDTCGQVKCGDQCIHSSAKCYCGLDVFKPYVTGAPNTMVNIYIHI